MTFIPSTTMTTFTGPVISAPSFGSAKNTLPLGVSFLPHPMTIRSVTKQSNDKFTRYTTRIWTIPSFLRVLRPIFRQPLASLAVLAILGKTPCSPLVKNGPLSYAGGLSSNHDCASRLRPARFDRASSIRRLRSQKHKAR